MLDAPARFVQNAFMLVFRVTAAVLVTALLVACGGGTQESKNASGGVCKDVPAAACVRGRTVVLVRHAEKAAEGGKDPSLSDRGRARAKTLAAMLASAGVTKILSTPYKRTQETVTPLSEKTSVPVEAMPPEKMRDAIKAAPDGAVIVIATHSNLVPGLVKDLAGAKLRGVEGDALAEDEFSRVVILSQPCGAAKASVVELSSTVE
jgi:phosphohistidine phosphatase SixA